MSLPSPASVPLLVFSVLFFAALCLCDPRANEAALICSNRTTPLPDRRAFASSVAAAMDAVSPQINARQYASAVDGAANNTVYAFAECMEDLDRIDCDLCVARAKC